MTVFNVFVFFHYILYFTMINMKYIHVKNNSNKLLIFFNDMAKVGTIDDKFSSFKILNSIFSDYDILFVKDIKHGNWYLSIIDDVYELIYEIVHSNNYNFIYGLTSSSGAICLLNTLHKFTIFRKAVIINGQTDLSDDIINKYKHNSPDCNPINKKSITEPYDEKFLTPFENIPIEMYYKYIFFYNNSPSDSVYYEYVKSIYPESLKSNIFFDETPQSHGVFVEFLLNNFSFLNHVKETFDKCSISIPIINVVNDY